MHDLNELSLTLHRTCKIGTNTLIGPSTQISENVQVISSVIGQNCTIGAGTIIDNSYIFENTVIGPNCKIRQSIVVSGCTIKENTHVKAGSLIGDDIVIGPDLTLLPFERLSAKRSNVTRNPAAEDSDEDSDLETVEESEGFPFDTFYKLFSWEIDFCYVHLDQDTIKGNLSLGRDSNALVWPRGPPDEEEDNDDVESYRNQRFMRLGRLHSSHTPTPFVIVSISQFIQF